LTNLMWKISYGHLLKESNLFHSLFKIYSNKINFWKSKHFDDYSTPDSQFYTNYSEANK